MSTFNSKSAGRSAGRGAGSAANANHGRGATANADHGRGATANADTNQFCWYFTNGGCSYGNRCRKLHATPVTAPVTAPVTTPVTAPVTAPVTTPTTGLTAGGYQAGGPQCDPRIASPHNDCSYYPLQTAYGLIYCCNISITDFESFNLLTRKQKESFENPVFVPGPSGLVCSGAKTPMNFLSKVPECSCPRDGCRDGHYFYNGNCPWGNCGNCARRKCTSTWPKTAPGAFAHGVANGF
jgi:hypothetical protein